MSRIILAAMALAIAAPAFAAERVVITPSGQPDVLFQGIGPAEAASKIANHCMNSGWQIISQSTNQVVCETRETSVLRSALQQALIGNSYSTTPRTFVRFNIAQVKEHSRAQAMAWVETQMAFGQMRQHQYTDNTTFNNLMGFLTNAGGELPPGTTFPGIYVGFDGQPISDGRKVHIAVSRVVVATPAAEAGLLVGDRILKVNGRTFKSMDDFSKQANRAAVGVRYPLVVMRDGQQQTLMVEARQRPTVGSPQHAAMIEATTITKSLDPVGVVAVETTDEPTAAVPVSTSADGPPD